MLAILKLVLWIAGVYVALLLAVWLFQRRLQYFPDPSRPALPSENEGLREVELASEDGVRLCAWYWPGERPLTLLLFHGNAGNRGDRLEWMRELRSLGVGVFALDYRGYGGSEGSPTEAGLVLDARAAVEWLARNVEGERVYVGESLGCGVALRIAELVAPAALVLQSGSACFADVAQDAYPYLPCSWLMRDRFDTRASLASLRAPLLAIHGDCDRIVALAHGRALYSVAPGPKEFYEVLGAGHDDVAVLGGDEYLQRIRTFLEAHGLLH